MRWAKSSNRRETMLFYASKVENRIANPKIRLDDQRAPGPLAPGRFAAPLISALTLVYQFCYVASRPE